MDKITALSIKMGSYIRRISDRLDELEKGYNEIMKRLEKHIGHTVSDLITTKEIIDRIKLTEKRLKVVESKCKMNML